MIRKGIQQTTKSTIEEIKEEEMKPEPELEPPQQCLCNDTV